MPIYLFFFLQGNVQRDAYILTQAPLSNTTEDFWRMVSQYDVSTVVMLNDLRKESEVNEASLLDFVLFCYPVVIVVVVFHAASQSVINDCRRE